MSCTTYVPISTRVIQQALSELRVPSSPWRPSGATIAPNPGPIDGRWGPRTQEALLAWMSAYPTRLGALCSARDVAPYRYELLESPRRATAGAPVVQAPEAAILAISTIAAAWRARGTVAPLAPVPSSPNPVTTIFTPGVQTPPMVLPDPPPADPTEMPALALPDAPAHTQATATSRGWLFALGGAAILGGALWLGTRKKRR